MQNNPLFRFFYMPLTVLGLCLLSCGGLVGDFSVGGVRLVEMSLAVGMAAACGSLALRIGLDRHDLPRSASMVFLAGLGLIVLPLAISLLAALHSREIDEPSAMKEFLQCFVTLPLLVFATSVPWKNRVFVRAIWLAGLALCLTNICFWLMDGMSYRFAGFSAHKNVTGGVSLCFVLFSLVVRLFRRDATDFAARLLLFMAAIILIYASGARTSLGCAIAAATVIISARALSFPRSVIWLSLIVVFLGVVVLPYGFLHLTQQSEFRAIHKFSSPAAASNTILSGREVFWSNLVGNLAEQPGFGHGTNWYFEFDGGRLHAHNLYLAKAYQVGFFGLACMLIFMFLVARHLIESRDPSWVFAFFCLMIHQCFEINLFMGGFTVGAALSVFVGMILVLSKVEHETNLWNYRFVQDEMSPEAELHVEADAESGEFQDVHAPVSGSSQVIGASLEVTNSTF